MNNQLFLLFPKFLDKTITDDELDTLFNYFKTSNDEELRLLIKIDLDKDNDCCIGADEERND